jgi:hypothetical protein
MNYRLRIGTFFIFLGLGLLALFVLSVLSNEITLVYLLFSILALFLGLVFRQRKKEPVDNGRFGLIRRANERSRQRRQQGMDRKGRKGKPEKKD